MRSQTRQVNAHERKMRALEMRKARASYAQIATALGVPKSTAWKLVQSALKETLQEPSDDVRKLELESLDRLQFALWQQATQGNHGAVDRVLRVMERRAKLLGLDAPSKTEHSGEIDVRSLSDAELEAIVKGTR
jgi:DNA-binding IclR family transcriptional regulator